MIRPMHSAQPRRTVAIFLAADFLYWASMYLYMPTLPGIIETRTGSLAAVGLVISMYGLWQAVARIPVGVAVDATGRSRIFIVAGFLLSAAGAVVMCFGRTTLALAAGRALTGLAAATWVPLVTVFGGLFAREQMVAATSLLNMVGGAGRLFALFAGGLLSETAGAPVPFVLAAASGLLALAALAGIRIPEAVPRPPTLARFLTLARRREVLVPTVAQTFASFANWAVTMTFMPVLAGRLGAGGTLKGMLMSIGTAASLAGSALAEPAERRFGSVLTLRAVFVAYCAGIVAAALSRSLAPLFLSATLMGFANGFYYPMLMGLAVRDVAVEERATATGIHQAVYATGMFAGPSVAGLVAERLGIRAMFALTAALTLSVILPLLHVLAGSRRRVAAAGAAPR